MPTTPLRSLIFLALLLGVTAEPLAAQEAPPSRMRFIHWMYEDLGGLAKATFTPRTGLYVLAGGGAVAGGAALDDDLQDAVHSIYEGSVRDALEVMDYLGGPNINLPVVLLAGGSLLTDSPRFQDAAFTSLQTLVYAGLMGYTLKGIFGRERPEATDDPYAFFALTGKNPFTHEGNSSFPSGHAIAAFGIVTPWVVYYPHPLTYSLYVLPAGTALSRLALDKHWSTDIAAGAVIGIVMGRWLSHRHLDRERPRDHRMELTLGADGRSFSLRMGL